MFASAVCLPFKRPNGHQSSWSGHPQAPGSAGPGPRAASPGQGRGNTQPKGATVPSKGRVRGAIGVFGGTRTAVQHI